jgi:CelD/BcsL family acetyltransferase involved in cellulose biosynthesis
MGTQMRVHQDWTTPAFGFAPLAPHTGPFARRDLLRAWWEHRAGPDDALALVEGAGGLVPLRHGADGVAFLGEEDLTDYHSPLGSGIAELLASYLVTLEPGTPFRFDSLPVEAAEPVEKAVGLAGFSADVTEHEVAAVLELPGDFETYLARLGKKERHEIRRKRRRFDGLLGYARLVEGDDEEGFDAFVAMHRMASGDKGEFMTPEMARYFSTLRSSGGRIHLLLGEGERPVAAAYGFEDGAGYYLYNSAYDPAAGDASPGIVLLAMLIEGAIERGMRVFDFLKGDEEYKFRHGAHRRPLLAVTGVAG